MKNLLLATVLILSGISYGQWDTYEYKDDFGDPTGNTFDAFQVVGLFSNSATTNGDCGFVFKHDVGESYTVIIYPYNRTTTERFIKGTFQTVKIKTPTGIEKIETFVSKGGDIFFSDENYKDLHSIISIPGEYVFLLNYENDYSTSKYMFTFTIF